VEQITLRSLAQESPLPVAPVAPIARHARLMCEGKCHRPTPHKFVMNRGVGAIGTYEQIYACETCYRERRFGLFG
jgi:hypothetical protein